MRDKHRLQPVAWRLAMLCAMAALLLLCGCSAAAETLPEVRIFAELMPDGSLQVSEQVVYALGARVRSISHTLEAARAEDIEDISVSARLPDGQMVFFRQQESATLSNSEALTMRRTDNTHVLLTLIHPFPVEGGRLMVNCQYTVRNVARRYPDMGTFTWDALGSHGWDADIERWSLHIALPITVQDPLSVARLAMPRHTEFTRGADGLRFAADAVKAGARARVRVDFPATALPYVSYAANQPLAALREQEQAMRNKALMIGTGWAALCLLATAGLSLWFYHRVDKDPRALPPTLRHGPSLGITAPAELSALMPLSFGAGSRDLAAMLLHLVHRNHLTLLPPPTGLPLTRATMDMLRITRRPAPHDTLLDGEFFLIHWLIDTLGDGKSVTLEQIRRAPRKQYRSDYAVWRRLVDEQVAQRPWFENLSPYREILAAVGGVFLLGTPLIALLLHAPRAWWALPVAALTVAYALRMRRRTPAAAMEVQRWRALQAQLKEGTVRGADTIAQWERILLYSEALGAGREAAEALQRAANAEPGGVPWPDAREATFLAWPLLEYGNRLPRWFELFCEGVVAK